MRYMQIIVLLIIHIFNTTVDAKVKNESVYISPGLQIGYTIDDGYYWDYQITLGYWIDDNDDPYRLSPGITVGVRNGRVHKLKYVDFQSSTFVGGVGIGYYSFEYRISGKMINSGIRAKAYGGKLLNGTYDVNFGINQNWGFILVAPVPLNVFTNGISY